MGQFDIARLPAAEARQAAIVFAAAEATEATLAIAQALLAEGRRIDIAGLDAEVARICAAALTVPAGAAIAVRMRLESLVRALDRVPAALAPP